MPTKKTVSSKDKAFSKYPNAMDEYFRKNNVIIKVLPAGVTSDIEKQCADFAVTSAEAYFEYLNEQIAFWETHDSTAQMKVFSYISRLKSAQTYFENATKHYTSGNDVSGNGSLKSSISEIQEGSLYSKTVLAKTLIKIYQGKSELFFEGFKAGLAQNKRSSVQQNIGFMEGVNAAFTFRKYYVDVCKIVKSEFIDFEEAITSATRNYSELNSKYVESFHQQEQRIAEFESFADENVRKIHKDTDELFKNIKARQDELEKLYREKLALEAPAMYWKKAAENYKKNGRNWLIASAVLSVIIVAMLIFIIVRVPDIVNDESHWFDVFKNSAIITVITSVAVYMLRVLVKMTLSSFHLTRDSSEREQLTYVYLALIEDKAITEKERAIVLNALFSRADTGLLKGDSTPTMSSNVTGLVDTLTKQS